MPPFGPHTPPHSTRRAENWPRSTGETDSNTMRATKPSTETRIERRRTRPRVMDVESRIKRRGLLVGPKTSVCECAARRDREYDDRLEDADVCGKGSHIIIRHPPHRDGHVPHTQGARRAAGGGAAARRAAGGGEAGGGEAGGGEAGGGEARGGEARGGEAARFARPRPADGVSSAVVAVMRN